MQLGARSDGRDCRANIEAPQRIRVDLEGFEFDFGKNPYRQETGGALPRVFA
jgi:hypothetical protein